MPKPPPAPLVAAPPDRPHPTPFHRGRSFPRAIAWFGLRSFWGHLWHLAASVIATEDIDSRDWMMPEGCAEFTRRVGDQLGAGVNRRSMTESLERDLWIDFIADTGDDADVSQAVAEMLFSAHCVVDDDGEVTQLPRGGILIFGGDTAYPVATDLEIHNRVTVPFNRVLKERHDGKRRVLLGIPGNHDWYAGLDGFGRMFRERRGRVDRASRVAPDETDTAGQIGHLIEWIEAFRVGTHVYKRPALPLQGYTTVQTASHWALRLAPKLQLWGVDRQLRSVDFRQKNFFAEARDRCEEDGLIFVMPDPAYAYLEPYAVGQRILTALDERVEDGHLVLSGDTHHYTRLQVGAGTHITAGGGGAFLHPTRTSRRGLIEPASEFPGPEASRALLRGAPLLLASGRAGVLVHLGLLLAYLPTFLGARSGHVLVAAVTSAVIALICSLLGGWRRDRAWPIVILSVIAGSTLGWLPLGVDVALDHLVALASLETSSLWQSGAWVLLSLFLGAWVFGYFLFGLFHLGLEHNQAAGMLAHPGYKHFVRLRVERDGSAVEGWVIGKVDPLDPREKAALVDHFVWKNPAMSEPPA